MTDQRIIELLWERNEAALSEIQHKYGAYCYGLAYNILGSSPDAEECVNDTYLGVWNSIPPERPDNFCAYIGKIARNLSLKSLRSRTAQKRGGTDALLSLDELLDCIPDKQTIDDTVDAHQLASQISAFLHDLPHTEQIVFVRRYWYCQSVKEIAHDFGFTQSKVKMLLLRTRQKLLHHLTEKGVFI